MNVISFGDSNTYGYDPRGYFGGRYAADSRWVDTWLRKLAWLSATWVRTAGRSLTPRPTFQLTPTC